MTQSKGDIGDEVLAVLWRKLNILWRSKKTLL